MGRAAGTDVASAFEAAADRKFERPRWHLKRARPMNELTIDARPLTSVELLDAAVRRGSRTEEPEPQGRVLEAQTGILGGSGPRPFDTTTAVVLTGIQRRHAAVEG